MLIYWRVITGHLEKIGGTYKVVPPFENAKLVNITPITNGGGYQGYPLVNVYSLLLNMAQSK